MSTFRIQEFARLAGVTVRTLHHYDRLGLLSAKHRTESGYRLYCHDDLGRLEQILVLRYLGVTLREIGEMLARAEAGQPESLPATLARQQSVLRQRRDEVDRVLRAIEHARGRAVNSAEPDWLLYQTILKEIQMQEPQNWIDKYYSPEGLLAIRERRTEWTPELQEGYQAKWQTLFAEIQSAMDRGVDLASDEAKGLAARWDGLLEAFTEGKPEVAEGLQRMYSDTENWPQDEVGEQLRAGLPAKGVGAFIWKVKNPNWTDRYYSPEGLVAIRRRRESWTPELAAEHHARWQSLFGDVQKALDRGVDPASDEGKTLAERWKAIGEFYTEGNPEIRDGLRRLYADVENWPDDAWATMLRARMPDAQHMAFIQAPRHRLDGGVSASARLSRAATTSRGDRPLCGLSTASRGGRLPGSGELGAGVLLVAEIGMDAGADFDQAAEEPDEVG